MRMFLLLIIIFPFLANAAQCSKNNFDMCKSCDQIAKAIDTNNPDYGDYYRGAFWNGLYASYVWNCPAVAENILIHGATPSLGGYLGSMGATLTKRWPHESESVNLRWADILIKHGFEVSKYTGDYKSAIEVWANDKDLIEYKSVWNKLVNSSERKPLQPERNIEWCASDGYKSVVGFSLQSCTSNAIKRLDDGISPASDISSVAVSSCKDEVNNFLSGAACRMAEKQQSDVEKLKVYRSLYNDDESKKEIISAIKDKVLEQVLEYRASKRN